MNVPQVYTEVLLYRMKISLCTNTRKPIYATHNQQIKYINRLQIIKYVKGNVQIVNSVSNVYDTGRNVNQFIKNFSHINSSELLLRKDLLA
jgi:hypothetical protein